MSDRANALAVYGSDLYVGGEFLQAGGMTVHHIARWDGQAWSSVAGGMSDGFWPAVTSLAVHEDRLIAGGWFQRAGATPASYIAAFDGTDWAALGDGVDNFVWSVVSYDGLIIAGGDFLNAGGTAAAHVAAWDGASWQPLGAGLSDFVRSASVFGGGLYLGGWFLQAGGLPSYYLARWDNAGGSAVGEREPVADGALRLRVTGGNPLGRQTRFAFTLDRRADVRLDVHDVQGRLVATLHDGMLEGGLHDVGWDGRSAAGRRVAPGVYFARLSAGAARDSRTLVLTAAP